MNRKLIKDYIDKNEIKVVKELDINTAKITYDLITINEKIHEIQGDEEMSRAFLLTKLVNELGYAPERIEIEHEYTAGRPHTNTCFADVIVRDSNGDAFLFIETKSPEEYNTIDKDKVIEEQLYKVAFMEKAEGHDVKYLVLYTTSENESSVNDECMIIDMKTFPTFTDWEKERNVTNDLPIKYGKAQKKPYIKDSDKDLETNFTSEMVTQLQTNLHDVLWGGGSTDDNEVFSSLTNIILAKIQDEDTTESGQAYKFQSLTFAKEDGEEFESNETLFERINNLYRDALKAKLYILDEKELAKSYVVDSKKFALSKLKYAVQKLEGLSFVDGKNSLNGKDILGEFFEGIIRNGFKQSKGQFFTPVNIVKFMLWGLQTDRLAIQRIKDDKEIPYMIDPSAGSGTFLIEYMKFITENMKHRFREELGTTRAVKDKIESDWFYPENRENKWAQTYIYASESNFNLGTATKVNMILHGDGSTNIFVKDGLLPFNKFEKETAPNVMHDSRISDLYLKKPVNGNFDLILTNPPFSVDLDNDTKKTIEKSFLFGDKKNSENLFIERWYQLLRPNGRVAAVLPDSVFDTAENKYIRLFLYKYFKIKAVISLPQLTFAPYTQTKTSILFAQKKLDKEIEEWNKKWELAASDFGKLKTRVENLYDVYVTGKDRAKLPSIKDLSQDEEIEIIKKYLKFYLNDEDTGKTIKEILSTHYEDIKEVGTIDKDIADVFGYVNVWWVFDELTANMDYDVLMAEVDNVGYKRTTKSEKEMVNELFTLEYAPTKLNTNDVINDFTKELDDLKQSLNNENERLKLLPSQKSKILTKIENLKNEISNKENNLEDIKSFLGKYYTNNILNESYIERTDKDLIKEFKDGLLKPYQSNYVALHKNTYETVLDYMRDIKWDYEESK